MKAFRQGKNKYAENWLVSFLANEAANDDKIFKNIVMPIGEE